MSAVASILSSAVVASLVSSVITLICVYASHSQHQKDVTVTEIRQVRNKLRSLNNQILDSINTNDMANVRALKLEAVTYLASWSVNVRYRRVDRHMIIYSLSPLLTMEYHIVRKILDADDYTPALNKAIHEVGHLLKDCDII